MTLDELRQLRKHLISAMEYCPPDSASSAAFQAAEERAIAAGKRYDALEPSFALLDAVDALVEVCEALVAANDNQAFRGGLSSEQWTATEAVRAAIAKAKGC